MLKFEKRGNSITIGYQTLGNSIPSACLLKYVAAVDEKLEHFSTLRGGRTHGSHIRHTTPRPSQDDSVKRILKQKGCECHNTIYLNFTSTTAR